MMDLKKFQDSWYSVAIIIFIAFVLLINNQEVDITKELLYASIGLITFPLILLSIYSIKNIRNSVRKKYSNQIEELDKKIASIREKQKNEKDRYKLLEYDKKIVELREISLGFQNDRILKNILFSLLFLIIS